MVRTVGYALLTTGLLLAVLRCDLAGPVERESLVVEAFLETGQSLPTVVLRQTRPMDAPVDSLAEGATGGQIELTLDGRRIAYESVQGRRGHYVPVNDTIVASNVTWHLEARWRSETARAQGTTPPAIALSQVCVDVPEAPVRAILVDSLRRDSLDIPAEQGFLYPIDVSLRWPTEPLASRPDSAYWMRAQLRPDTAESSSRVVDFFLQPDEVRREDQFGQQPGQRRWQGVYAVPVNDSTAALPRHTLTASLVRGDTAFAAFARSRNDPDQREPISNVEGGLGIATAVAVDSMRRTVKPGLERCRHP